MTGKDGPTWSPTSRLCVPARDTLTVPPQLALCRCGGSSRQPSCDGTCAGNGFTDNKDPHRVPDQRDTTRASRSRSSTTGASASTQACARTAGRGVPDQPGAVRRAERRPDGRDRAGGARLPVRALGLAFDGEQARDLADWHGRREPAIEITQDGPYRVTGAIPLADADGADVPRRRARPASTTRSAAAATRRTSRSGSGMHWYAGFRDPVPSAEPTLFEWAGGLPALTG